MTMKANARHYEEWHITLQPEPNDVPGDTWPDVRGNRYGTFKPDMINIHLRRGDSQPVQAVSGYVYKLDGTLGKRRDSARAAQVPWVQEIIETYRKENDLGPGSTGVDW